MIDSPVYPEELRVLPGILEQAGYPVSGLLATHGDWDHLLGRVAFPGAAVAAGESTVARLGSELGAYWPRPPTTSRRRSASLLP